MSVLRDDGFSRRGSGGWASDGAVSRTRGLMILAAMFASLALLVLSRFDHHAVRALRIETTETVTPLLDVLSQPAAYVERARRSLASYSDLLAEVERLRKEKQHLEQWHWRALKLEAEVEQMRKLLNGVRSGALAFVTARVVAEGRGPFTRSVLVNAGRSAGVRNGHAVVDGSGFVGRVVETSETAARILLLSDPTSRIPVYVGQTSERAIVRGKGSARPVLEFLPGASPIAAGTDVVTSGEDGLLPKGLRVGRVAAAGDGVPLVDAAADLGALDYVSILLYEAPGLDLAGDTGGARSARTAVASER